MEIPTIFKIHDFQNQTQNILKKKKKKQKNHSWGVTWRPPHFIRRKSSCIWNIEIRNLAIHKHTKYIDSNVSFIHMNIEN